MTPAASDAVWLIKRCLILPVASHAIAVMPGAMRRGYNAISSSRSHVETAPGASRPFPLGSLKNGVIGILPSFFHHRGKTMLFYRYDTDFASSLLARGIIPLYDTIVFVHLLLAKKGRPFQPPVVWSSRKRSL
jgi:hypothetical protein